MREFAFLLLAVASAPAIAQELVGTFSSTIEAGAQKSTMTLRCVKDSACALVIESQDGKEKPSREILPLRASLLADNRQADSAFNFVLKHKDADVAHHPENNAIMYHLRPMLAGKPAIDKCWDLNWQGEDYLVACTVAHVPWNHNSILLMATLLSDNCPPPFCRYIVYRMYRRGDR